MPSRAPLRMSRYWLAIDRARFDSQSSAPSPNPESSVVARGVVALGGWIVCLGGQDCRCEPSNPPVQEVHLEGDEKYDVSNGRCGRGRQRPVVSGGEHAAGAHRAASETRGRPFWWARQRRSAHDPGRVLCDLAVMGADGGSSVSDLAVMAGQGALFWDIASVATARRVLLSVGEAEIEGLRQARALARERAWKARAAPDRVVLDFDATPISIHSEKELAAGHYKGGFGFNPLIASCGREVLAGILRPGNAGANNAQDHLQVLELALEQLPESAPEGEILTRSDSAGASHDFAGACRETRIHFSLGYAINSSVREQILALDEAAWTAAVNQDRQPREGAWVTELTGLLDLSSWPSGTRLICRRERPHPGAQLSFTDCGGHRFQCFITDQDDPEGGAIASCERTIPGNWYTGRRALSGGRPTRLRWPTRRRDRCARLPWRRRLDRLALRADPDSCHRLVCMVGGMGVRQPRRLWLLRGVSVPRRAGLGSWDNLVREASRALALDTLGEAICAPARQAQSGEPRCPHDRPDRSAPPPIAGPNRGGGLVPVVSADAERDEVDRTSPPCGSSCFFSSANRSEASGRNLAAFRFSTFAERSQRCVRCVALSRPSTSSAACRPLRRQRA